MQIGTDDIDTDDMRVTLSPEKCQRPVTLITELGQSTTVLPDIRSLAGHLAWAARVIPVGKALNAKIWPSIASFRNRSGMRKRVPPAIGDDLQWWTDEALRLSKGSRILDTTALPVIHLFPDASNTATGSFWYRQTLPSDMDWKRNLRKLSSSKTIAIPRTDNASPHIQVVEVLAVL